MEGIATVLRNGRVLTSALAESGDYMLMVITPQLTRFFACLVVANRKFHGNVFLVVGSFVDWCWSIQWDVLHLWHAVWTWVLWTALPQGDRKGNFLLFIEKCFKSFFSSFHPILVFCRLVACAADERQPLVKSVCEPELKSLFWIPICVPGFTVKAGQAYPSRFY